MERNERYIAYKLEGLLKFTHILYQIDFSVQYQKPLIEYLHMQQQSPWQSGCPYPKQGDLLPSGPEHEQNVV